jgi:hypothetical protein
MHTLYAVHSYDTNLESISKIPFSKPSCRTALRSSKLPPGKVNTTRMQSMWDKVDLKVGNAIKDGEKSLNIPTKS